MADLSAPLFDRRKVLATLGLGWMAAQFPGRALALGFAGNAEETRAMEVSEYLQKNYWDQKRNLFKTHQDKGDPTPIWGGGIMFSSLVGAARHDKKYVNNVRDYFRGLDSYWDSKTKIPGYEPVPTGGNGNDKYYDDNAWMVLTFIEAYELTGDVKFLRRAKDTLTFVLSGWDDQRGGGIWWHVAHKDDAKNTCINAPAALGCFYLSKFSDMKTAASLVEQGKKVVEWTTRTLQAPSGLFMDCIKVSSGEINRGTLTYNSALMLRCYLWLHTSTRDQKYLTEALRIGKAAEGLLDQKTGAYRDPEKWAHLMVEADFELYRHTRQVQYYTRAKKNCEVHYEKWKQKPDGELIDVASVARELWLAADMETTVGKQFWDKADRIR